MRPVVFAAPFPLQTTLRFARAAAKLDNVRLLGLWQEPPRGADRELFADVAVVKDALSTDQLKAGVDALRARNGDPHRIVGVLEPLQVQLAAVREHFGVLGTDVETAVLFRDKARMKDRLRAAGLPVARHALLTNTADGEAFAKDVGFPMVVKPPAGMGAQATFRVKSAEQLRAAVAGMAASAANPVLAEEFLRGTEGSFDTITTDGEPRLVSISHYRPTPLEVIENPWMQWRCVLPRDIHAPVYDEVHRVGRAAIAALGLKDGFTHMEWFQREDGSVAIGEIAQRPPGAHITRMIGLSYDLDPYRAWARAVIDSAFDGPAERRFAVGCAYFRGMGRGRVLRVEGVAEGHIAAGEHVVETKLPTPGAPKSASYEGDGHAIVRHPDTDVVERALLTLVDRVRVHYT